MERGRKVAAFLYRIECGYHSLVANLSYRQSKIGYLIKGKEIQLVNDGQILWENMKTANVTEHDLREAMRSNAKMSEIEKIKAAYLERSGDISFIS